MTTGILITTRGLVEQRDFSGLEDYQAAVGGLIEAVYSADGKIEGFANEEGMLRGLDANVIASILFSCYLVGDIVVIGPADDEGRTTDAPEEARLRLEGIIHSKIVHAKASPNLD